MKNVSVVRLMDRINSLFDKARELPDSDEIRSHWARYLCVLVSGFIEESVRLLLFEYVSNHSDKRTQSFTLNRLERLQNPKFGNILEVLGHFDQTWRESFESQNKGEIGDAITSVVDVRHKIAHGKSTGISLATISDYWRRVVSGIEHLEKIVC